MPHALVLFGAVCLSLSSCGSESRPDVLQELASDTIVPVFDDLAATTADLSAATDALCDAPSTATLDDARSALAATRIAWSTSEPMWVGPVMDRRSWAVIDWPIAADEIDALIADDEPLTTERLGKRVGADQRGLAAIEYILGAPDDDRVVDQLGDERRCGYLTAVAAVIADEAGLLPGDWVDGLRDGPPFIETFVDPDSEALDDLVNDSVFLLEAMTDGELGTALGEMDREADLDAIVEGPAGLAVGDLTAHLHGLRLVMVGENERRGLGPLLGDDISDRLIAAFDAADVAVAAIDGDLATAITERPDDVSAARAALKSLQILVNTEVVSQLGVTIGFSDADGDTGA